MLGTETFSTFSAGRFSFVSLPFFLTHITPDRSCALASGSDSAVVVILPLLNSGSDSTTTTTASSGSDHC